MTNMHEVRVSVPVLSSFYFLHRIKEFITGHCYGNLGLVHKVERVLSMHEVPGSMTGTSSSFFTFQDCISGL